MKRPEVLRQFGKWWIAQCPGCGLEARIDDDQYHGRVSIDCPACPYHETHDLSVGDPRGRHLTDEPCVCDLILEGGTPRPPGPSRDSGG